MAFFKVSKDKEMTEDFKGTGGFLNNSGMYTAIIKRAIVDAGANGSQFINLILTDGEDNDRIIFQAYRLTKNDGTENKVGIREFNKLCVVCGFEDEIADPEPETFKMSKNSTESEHHVLKDLEGCEIVIHVKNEYSVYKQEIKDSKIVRNVFRTTDFASAEEISQDSEKGKQHAFELKTATQDILRDNLTEEDVTAYKEAQRSGKKASAPKDNTPSGGFANRFGKK